MSDTQYSPLATSREEPAAPWTIDNSESRVSSGISNSPRGILKASKTPNPYISPQFNRIQNERIDSMINRRVSFASATRVRYYGKNETPNSPSHRTLNQKLPAISPDANDDLPVPSINQPDKGETRPDAGKSDNAYISRLSGSPMDRRKRRRDIFGSPPGQRPAKRPSVIYPEHRVRGMRTLDDDDNDDDDDNSDNNFFMQFLARGDQQRRKRLFDEDDDDGENDTSGTKDGGEDTKKKDADDVDGNNRDDAERATQTSSALDTKGSTYVSSLTPRNTRELSPRSLFADNDNEDEQQRSASPPHRLSPFTEENGEKVSIPLDSLLKQSQTSAYSQNEDTGTMPLTQQHNAGVVNNRQPGTPIDDTTELWNATATADVQQHEQQQRRQSSQTTSQSTGQLHDQPLPVSFTHPSALGSQFSSQKNSQDSDMRLTQDFSTLRNATTSKETHHPINNQPNRTPYPFNASSPIRTPVRSPLRSPLDSTNNSNLINPFTVAMAKSPRAGMSILDTMDASPILPRQSPLVDRSHTPSHPPPPPPASNLFSPKRSFYLHDPTPSSHSPSATLPVGNVPLHASPRRVTKSPLRQEQSLRANISDHSIGSDYGDRMISMNGDENFNIFEEELPQLYDSFIDDTPTSKPMTLAYFLDTAAGFKQLVEDRPLPKQTTYSGMDHTTAPATFDQQATAAASILPELDAYHKIIEKHEHLNEDLSARLQQLDDDLSENIPQVFAEYANATPDTVDEMENNFAIHRKLANAESEQEWYANYIPMVQDLESLFNKQLESQLKDQQLVLETKDRLDKYLPQLTSEKHKMAETLKENMERIQKYKQMDHKRLESWENEIEAQKAFIEKSRKEAHQVEEKDAQMRKELTLLDERKADLKATVAKAEATIAAHPYVSETDLDHARDQCLRSSDLCAFKLEEKTDRTLQFTIYGDLDVLIDTTKLKNHQVDAVLIRMLESKDRQYGPFAELVHGLQALAKESWSQEKIIQDIAIYWNRLRMIRSEIMNVKRRFWIELEPHSESPFTDTEMRGFRCTVTVFSFMANLKFQLSFDIHPKNVMAYPHCLDLSQLHIEFVYGDTTPEYLDTLIKHKLEEFGIVGLVDTLASIIDDFR